MNTINKRILHVEDDIDVQRYIATLLKNTAELIQIASFKQAIEVIKHEDFDLVLLDLTLPDGSGLEILKLIRELTTPPPVIIFSAHEVTEMIPGANKVFVKGGFLDFDIVNSVEQLLAQPG